MGLAPVSSHISPLSRVTHTFPPLIDSINRQNPPAVHANGESLCTTMLAARNLSHDFPPSTLLKMESSSDNAKQVWFSMHTMFARSIQLVW